MEIELIFGFINGKVFNLLLTHYTVRPAWEFNQIGSIQFGFKIYIIVKKTFQGKQCKKLESKILSG